MHIYRQSRNTASHNDLTTFSKAILKLVKSSLDKMRSIVVCLLVLSIFLAIVSMVVDGGNTSIASKKIPAKLDDKTVICNVVQDSHSQEAIKSLEANLVAALENKFEQLMETINKTHGNSAGKASLMLFYPSSCLVYFFMTYL